MDYNFSHFFQYLEKEKIQFDKTEFLFQIQSHPDYPSLLAISDALTFFKIDNAVVKVSFDEIEYMPNFFISLLKEEGNSKPKLCLVNQDKGRYFLLDAKKKIEIKTKVLATRWTDINFLIEKTDEEVISKQKSIKYRVFGLLFATILIGIFIQSSNSIFSKLFSILPTVGFLFSIAALKDLFGVKSELINNLCNITSSASCSDVVNSSKWKFLKYISFSDLSIVFFTSQIVLYLIAMIAEVDNHYFSLQYLLLLSSLPITLLSIYYQKFIEKKWCPICLIIISVVFLELAYLLLFIDFKPSFSLKSITIFALIFLLVISGWSILKKALLNIKNLKEFQLKSNRFYRNYQNFRTNLLSNDKLIIPGQTIDLGIKNPKIEITIVTHPFCTFCKKAHEDLNSILEKYPDDIQIKIIFKVNIDDYDENTKNFFRHLMNLYVEGESVFNNAIKSWFELRDEKEWKKLFLKREDSLNNEKHDILYKMHNDWCIENSINYTPLLLINGYKYPKTYDRDSLEFFINELISDDI